MRRLAAITPGLLGAIGLAVNAGSAPTADMKEIGSFHVGGQQLTLQDLPLAEAFRLEAALGQRTFTSEDARRGLAAFANRGTGKS